MKKKYISLVKWRMLRRQLNLENQSILNKGGFCMDCKKNYCCINQRHIEVFNMEFDTLSYYITDEHINRARKEMKRTDGLISCPFNNPETGKCEIYDDRFSICSSQGVVTPSEDCDTITKPGRRTKIADRMAMFPRLFKESKMYIQTLANTEEVHDIIAQFKRVYGENNEITNTD